MLFPLSTSASQNCESGLGKPSTTEDWPTLCGDTLCLYKTGPCSHSWLQNWSTVSYGRLWSPFSLSVEVASSSQAADCCKIQQNQSWKWNVGSHLEAQVLRGEFLTLSASLIYLLQMDSTALVIAEALKKLQNRNSKIVPMSETVWQSINTPTHSKWSYLISKSTQISLYFLEKRIIGIIISRRCS